ncbi:MAG: TonB-dependent receptor [Balneolaceae bacterium]|nr:TonB-dependent receptor [Balneolaceae bacterium]
MLLSTLFTGAGPKRSCLALAAAAFLLFTLGSHTLQAQTVSGRVLDAGTGDPLPSANILQAGTSNGTSTGDDGTFRLTMLEDASPILRITYVGYRTRRVNVEEGGTDLEISLEPTAVLSNAAFVSALRVDESTPMAYENISREELEKRNLGQDVPYLLGNTPSVTTTSDAGTGIGYSAIRIRGVDQTRINVTINGVPLNDAESHGVFWVNLPDLASSVENIQIQRGVGTSTNGAAAFGSSINIRTTGMNPEPYGEVNTSVGSFATRKANVMLGSGLMDNGWQFEGRLSKIASDGYIDRAWSDLKSFYLSGSKQWENSLLRADVFAGEEHTYQAWYGVSESRLEEDRTYNPAGQEKEGEPYDNQTDNYQQDHYQLHYSHDLGERWKASASLHYTYGRGYYEEYHAGEPLEDYGIGPVQAGGETVTQSDLVRRLWLDNHFYGGVWSAEYREEGALTVTAGGGYNEYLGSHFGEVVWARFAGQSDVDERYYDNDGVKTDFNSWVKANWYLTDSFNVFADAQVRHITYEFLGVDTRPRPGGGEEIVNVEQTDRLTFFNPKLGAVWRPSPGQRVYVSLSVGNKEPTRDEYVNSTPENRPAHESLYDWELGWRATGPTWQAGVNLYYMDYKDQLILTGEINDVGAYVRRNVPESYRAGIELQGGLRLLPGLEWSGNATLSRNRIERYTYYLDNYDTGGQEADVYEDAPIAFSPSLVANSMLSFTAGEFTGEWTSKHVSRQYLDNTGSRSRSLDPYWINDLRFSYGFGGLDFAQNIRATLQLNNILDHRYESNGYTFGYISGGERQFFNYYYPQAGRNVMLELSMRF